MGKQSLFPNASDYSCRLGKYRPKDSLSSGTSGRVVQILWRRECPWGVCRRDTRACAQDLETQCNQESVNEPARVPTWSLVSTLQTLGPQDTSSAKCQRNTAEVASCQQGCPGGSGRVRSSGTWLSQLQGVLKGSGTHSLWQRGQPFGFRTKGV